VEFNLPIWFTFGAAVHEALGDDARANEFAQRVPIEHAECVSAWSCKPPLQPKALGHAAAWYFGPIADAVRVNRDFRKRLGTVESQA
jgi:hypothetical protein